MKKYTRVPLKSLESVILDFYTSDDITIAKDLLTNEIDELHIEQWRKSIRVRKDSVTRTPNEVDDILSAIAVLDEKLLTKNFPCFVSADPDHMPSMKLSDGNLSAVMTKLSKMEDVVTAVRQGVDQSSNTLSQLMSMNRDNANTSRLGLRNIRQKNQRDLYWTARAV